MSEPRKAILVDGVGRCHATALPAVTKELLWTRKTAAALILAEARQQISGDAKFTHLGATEDGVEVYGFAFTEDPQYRLTKVDVTKAELLFSQHGPVRQLSPKTWISRGSRK